jgi:anaerobic C4-dicarboxylate transporter
MTAILFLQSVVVLAAITTKIGRYVLNHSFMIPGLVATFVAVVVGFALAHLMF